MRYEDPMPRWGQLFILYFLSTAGLVTSVFLLGDMTLFYEGMAIIGVILITNIIVVSSHMNR
jgi:cytochrome c oxidase subunit IV